jgi:hypothetical protein
MVTKKESLETEIKALSVGKSFSLPSKNIFRDRALLYRSAGKTNVKISLRTSWDAKRIEVTRVPL